MATRKSTGARRRPARSIRVDTSHPFALRVTDDSMKKPCGCWPSYSEGDYLHVDPAREPKPGDFVVLQRGDSVFFRQYVVEGDRRFVRVLNPESAEKWIELDRRARILGTVTGCEIRMV